MTRLMRDLPPETYVLNPNTSSGTAETRLTSDCSGGVAGVYGLAAGSQGSRVVRAVSACAIGW
jgi:hypothetical protein